VSSLLKFQIGPVQEFIAAARSTRDLWSGSYLLSWLVAEGIRKLIEIGGTPIFPNPEGQQLLDNPDSWESIKDQQQVLTPNLPNLFIGKVPDDKASDIAKAVSDAIKTEWTAIATAVWGKHTELAIPADKKGTFNNAVDKHLSIAWQLTPITGGGYQEAYRDNGWHLDAVRQTRDFAAWGGGEWIVGTEKDSLTGKEEALCGGTDWLAKIRETKGEIPALFKHADQVGPITFIKRTWHAAYLRGKGLKTKSDEFTIRSIPAIAARTNEVDDDREIAPMSGGEKYIAAIAFDGDSIGKWVNGDFLPEHSGLAEHHAGFSKALSTFALEKVRTIVEAEIDGTDKRGKPTKVPLGQLIYAGGDDVVALVPADVALETAARIRDAFKEATKEIKGTDPETIKPVGPDASAGIAIAHIHAPLQDLIRAAQLAERHAKSTIGKPSFSITLMKRSGEISCWGAKWDLGGLDLYEKIDLLLSKGHLSAKFPHRVCQLLDPYLTTRTGLSQQAQQTQQADAITDPPAIKSLLVREFNFAVERQSSPDHKANNLSLLSQPLKTYLDAIQSAHDELTKRRKEDGKEPPITSIQSALTALLGLCTTVAFAHRNRPESAS